MIHLKKSKLFLIILFLLFSISLIKCHKTYAAAELPNDLGKIIRLTPREEDKLPFADFHILTHSSKPQTPMSYTSKEALRGLHFPPVVYQEKYKGLNYGHTNGFRSTLGYNALQFHVNRKTAPFVVFYRHAAILNHKPIGIAIIFFPGKFHYTSPYSNINLSQDFARGFYYTGVRRGYVDYRFFRDNSSKYHPSWLSMKKDMPDGVLSFGSLNGVMATHRIARKFLEGKRHYKGLPLNPDGWKYPLSPSPLPYTQAWGYRHSASVMNTPGYDGITGEFVNYINNPSNRVFVTDDRRNTSISKKYYGGQHTRTGTNITKYFSPEVGHYVIGGRPNGLFPDTYGPGHHFKPEFDWNSEFFLTQPYYDPENNKSYPYDNIFQFGSGEGIDGGSAWAVLDSHMFYHKPGHIIPKKCVRIHYVDAKTGNEVRTPIRAGQAKLHWSNKSQKKYWITLKGYRNNWNKYSLGAAQEGFQLAKSSDKFGSRAKSDAQHAHENLDSMNKDGRYTFTYNSNGNCHNLYVFLTVPPRQPNDTILKNKAGEIHKTLEEQYKGKYRIVPGYPTPSNPNGAAPSTAAKTSYGSRHYAYLVWGRIPSRTHVITFTVPKIKDTIPQGGGALYTDDSVKTYITVNPYKDALVHIFDTLSFSNSNNNYRTAYNSDGIASDIARTSSNNGKPNNKRYAYLYKIDALGKIGGKVTNDPPVNSNYKSQQALNIILAEDGPSSLSSQDKPQYEGSVSQYANQLFAYRLRIRVGKDKDGKSLLPGINGTAKNGDTSHKCSTDNWNKFNGHDTNANSNNFKFWNHAYMNWRLQDFDMSTKSNDKHSIYNFQQSLFQDEKQALAKNSHKLNSQHQTIQWDKDRQSDLNSFMRSPHTVTTTAETDHKSPFSQYIPLRIPMIHYDIYHYNYGNGSQNISPDVVRNDGYNDTWHHHFKSQFINPTTTGNRRGWLFRDWGFGYSGQPVKVPIIPKIPTNAKHTSHDYSADITKCSSDQPLNLKNSPYPKLNDFQFAYKDSDYYKTHTPFERIVLGKNGNMRNDSGKNGSNNTHDQSFYKPYVKPQMGMDYGRLIVDTGNTGHQFTRTTKNGKPQTKHGLRFWMEFKSDPIRWTPGSSNQTDNVMDDFKNTNIRIRITDPSNGKKLYQVKYPATDMIGMKDYRVTPVYVPVPKNGFDNDSGVLNMDNAERNKYQKGDAVPLKITIKSVPQDSSKPYANYWDGIHYSDGYVATDDTVQAKDFRHKSKHNDKLINKYLGNSAKKPNNDSKSESADSSANIYHEKITGHSDDTNQDTTYYSTRHVKIIQPERTIKYLTGNFVGRDDSADVGSGMSSKLQGLAKGNQANSEKYDTSTHKYDIPAQDPAVRIQREWMDIHQNNRKPYLVNLDSKKTYTIHQSADTGAYDKVNINGTTYDLSDKSKDKELKAKHYAAVYPATFKTGYGIRPDITVTYGGNVDSKNYLNNGTNMKFSFPSEWGNDGNTAEVDGDDIEKDNPGTLSAFKVHEHDRSDTAHVGRVYSSTSSNANEKEHDASQHNHSIPSPAYDATNLGKTKHKYALSRQTRLISDSDVGGDLVPMMDLESSPTKYDNYKGSDSWPMAHKLDNAFDETLHDIYTGGSSVSIAQRKLKPAIPTTVGHATMNYTFPLQTLSNDGGKASKDGNSSTDMTGPKNQLQKVFTPVWLPLGYYQTVFEKAYSQTSRLGGNWFNFEIGRPDTAVAHMMLSDSNPEDVDSTQFKDMNDVVRQTKDGKLVSADEQLLDELSLQPVMTRQITKFNKAADFPNTGRSMSQDVLSNEKYHSSNYDWPWQTFSSNFIK